MVSDEHIIHKVQRELSKQAEKAKAGEGDRKHKSVQHLLHHILKSVHKATFESPNVKTLADAKSKHQACVDLSEPDDVDEK